MNRRKAIGNIVLLSIGSVIIPSCNQKDEPSIKLNNFSLTAAEGELFGQLSDTIVPPANFNAEDNIKPHDFTLMMVDDCYEPDRQKKFVAGLKQFDKMADKKYNNSFIKMNAAQKKELLAGIESKKDIPEEVLFFYETTKRHTLQALTSSRSYMTNVLKYKMVPGSNFKGCVPVTKS
ncbi:MAG: gluconate 2-dehydrogenase subunit 3 family protein [Ferruginibacter sp.]